MVTKVTVQKDVQRVDRISGYGYGRCQCGVPVFAGKIRRKNYRPRGPGRADRCKM